MWVYVMPVTIIHFLRPANNTAGEFARGKILNR